MNEINTVNASIGFYIIAAQAEKVDNSNYKTKWYLRFYFDSNGIQFCTNSAIATAFCDLTEAEDALNTIKKEIKPIVGFKIIAYTIEVYEPREVMRIEC